MVLYGHVEQHAKGRRILLGYRHDVLGLDPTARRVMARSGRVTPDSRYCTRLPQLFVSYSEARDVHR